MISIYEKFVFLIAQIWFNIPEFFINAIYVISVGILKLMQQPAPLVVGGLRPAKVYVPSSYTSSTPIPLLIMLHGFSSDSGDYDNDKGLAESRGFAYIAPNGIYNSLNMRFWKATDACCDIVNIGQDDSSYLAGLIKETANLINVDK